MVRSDPSSLPLSPPPGGSVASAEVIDRAEAMRAASGEILEQHADTPSSSQARSPPDRYGSTTGRRSTSPRRRSISGGPGEPGPRADPRGPAGFLSPGSSRSLAGPLVARGPPFVASAPCGPATGGGAALGLRT